MSHFREVFFPTQGGVNQARALTQSFVLGTPLGWFLAGLIFLGGVFFFAQLEASLSFAAVNAFVGLFAREVPRSKLGDCKTYGNKS